MSAPIKDLAGRAAKRRAARQQRIRSATVSFNSERLLMVDYFDRLPIASLRAVHKAAVQMFGEDVKRK